MNLSHKLRRLALNGELRPIDIELGIRMGEVAMGDAGEFSNPMCLAGVLASAATDAGDSCIPLDRLTMAMERCPALARAASGVSADEIGHTIESRSPLVGRTWSDPRPLIVEHGRLYLQRYAAHEFECARRLGGLLNAKPDEIETSRLKPDSEGYLFTESDRQLRGKTNWQAVACALALRHRLTVLSGGPGTGKTYVLALIALLLLERAHQNTTGQPFRIALAAPTGKAAQRLREVVRRSLDQYFETFKASTNPDDIAYVQDSGKTLHRLLGVIPGEIEFRHDENNPLEVDCLIIDECSMVDLPLMTRTLRALKPDTRLVLVGDRQQLFPVEAGSVFAELFTLSQCNRFDIETARTIHAVCGIEVVAEESVQHLLNGRVAVLEHSFRANDQVGLLGRDIQSAEIDPNRSRPLVEALPGRKSGNPVSRDEVPELQIRGTILERCSESGGWFVDLHQATTPDQAIAALNRFRILCAIRQGPHGVVGINTAVESAIQYLYTDIDLAKTDYHLRPILVTTNDYRLKLFNGDIGVLFKDDDGRTGAYFEKTDHEGSTPGTALRRFLPSQLPPHETCYAMTIHKSQGSEFEKVVVVLPHQAIGESLILSRELVYTGVTRAKNGVEIWAPSEILIDCLKRKSERFSGLAVRLSEGKQEQESSDSSIA